VSGVYFVVLVFILCYVCWKPRDKTVYFTATLKEPVAFILHGVPSGAMYEEVTKADSVVF
jgi:hypothetical protein